MNNITKTKILKSKTFKPEFLIEYVNSIKNLRGAMHLLSKISSFSTIPQFYNSLF